MFDVQFDLILRNGRIFDGLGSPPFHGDIAIKNGKIAAIGQAILAPAREIKECADFWVIPGFIDIHTHYDIEVEISPGLNESVQHGVTTVVMGNCSLSVTYGNPKDLADMFLRVETLPRILIEKWLKTSISWETPKEYFEHLKSLPLGPSISALLGHSSLRAYVMGLQRSLHDKATDEELAKMRALAEKALDAGCIGISVDMVPWHMMSGEFKGKTIPS
jgi:N-acyl-D-aspartate/D-glutamate deacylase